MNMQSLLQVDLFLQISGITPGRAAAIVPAVIGLIGMIIGRLALTRSARRISSGRLMGIVALVLGLIGIVLSGLHLARATGDIGTGSGRLGAIVALVLGLIGMVLGGLALARSRRIARRNRTAATTSPRERT
jgi:FtsH-binding integral membrane protein